MKSTYVDLNVIKKMNFDTRKVKDIFSHMEWRYYFGENGEVEEFTKRYTKVQKIQFINAITEGKFYKLLKLLWHFKTCMADFEIGKNGSFKTAEIRNWLKGQNVSGFIEVSRDGLHVNLYDDNKEHVLTSISLKPGNFSNAAINEYIDNNFVIAIARLFNYKLSIFKPDSQITGIEETISTLTVNEDKVICIRGLYFKKCDSSNYKNHWDTVGRTVRIETPYIYDEILNGLKEWHGDGKYEILGFEGATLDTRMRFEYINCNKIEDLIVLKHLLTDISKVRVNVLGMKPYLDPLNPKEIHPVASEISLYYPIREIILKKGKKGFLQNYMPRLEYGEPVKDDRLPDYDIYKNEGCWIFVPHGVGVTIFINRDEKNEIDEPFLKYQQSNYYN